MTNLIIVGDTSDNPESGRFCGVLGDWNPFSEIGCRALDEGLGDPRRFGTNFVLFPVRG